MQQQTHLTSNKIPRQPKKIWKQVLLRKTKEKLYPKVLDNYRGSRDMNLGQTQNLRHSQMFKPIVFLLYRKFVIHNKVENSFCLELNLYSEKAIK